MAIANANLVYSGNGPTATGQVLATRSDAGNFSRVLYGKATFTGDAASSTAVLNYIDGTATLPFIPSLLLCNRIGGAATSTIAVVSIVDNGDQKGATITWSTTVNAATMIVGVAIFA
jgi:hypothetical protein